jgi:hypothetical protein
MPKAAAAKPPRSESRPGIVLGRRLPAERSAPVGFGRSAAAASVPGELIVDASDAHVAVFAPTGAGKGRNILVPTLLTSSDSAIVMDVKGELARITSNFRREGLGQQVHILDPWREVTVAPDSFNPLDCLDADDPGLVDDAYALAGLLVDQNASFKEVYWDERAQALIAGLIVHVVTCKTETDRSFGRIWQLVHGDDTIYDLAVLLDTVKDVHPFAKAQIAALLNLSADQTRSCVVSVIRQHLRLFGSDRVTSAIARTSIDLSRIASGAPTTIYLVVPPDKLQSHGGIIRLWLSALLSIITVGMCVGFLPHHFNPAKIFMGDSGALFLGLLMAIATSVVGGREAPGAEPAAGQAYFFLAPLFIPLFILGVPILDTLWAIIRRARNGQGVATADKGHLHHRLMEMGHGQRRSVLILWGWTALLSAFVLYPVLTDGDVAYVPIGAAMLVLVLYTVLHPQIRAQRNGDH